MPLVPREPNATYAVWVWQFSDYTGDSIMSYVPLLYHALGYFTTDELNLRRGAMEP